jgi:hypothetical protein
MGGGKVLEVVPKPCCRFVPNGNDGSGQGRRVCPSAAALRPEVPATKLHGIKGSQADQGPGARAEASRDGAQEPERSARGWAAHSDTELVTHGHSYRAIPERVLSAGSAAGGTETAGAVPGLHPRTGDAIDGKAPQRFLDGIVAPEAPGRRKGSTETGESGRGCGADGRGQSQADERGMKLGTVSNDIRSQQGRVGADRNGGCRWCKGVHWMRGAGGGVMPV